VIDGLTIAVAGNIKANPERSRKSCVGKRERKKSSESMNNESINFGPGLIIFPRSLRYELRECEELLLLYTEI
jgi:hypothetical protein